MRRPVAVLVPTLGLLLVLGFPFLHVRFNAPDATILPATVPSRASYELLAREFGEGAFAPLTLAIRTTGPATDPATLAVLYDYSRRLAADPRVTRVVSLVDVDPRLTLAQYQLLYSAPTGPPRPVRPGDPRLLHGRRPDRVQRLHALRSERRRAAEPSSRTFAQPTDRSPRLRARPSS